MIRVDERQACEAEIASARAAIERWIDGHVELFAARPIGRGDDAPVLNVAATELAFVLRALQDHTADAPRNAWVRGRLRALHVDVTRAASDSDWLRVAERVAESPRRIVELTVFVERSVPDVPADLAAPSDVGASDVLSYLHERCHGASVDWAGRLAADVAACARASPKATVPLYDLTHDVFYATDFGRRPLGELSRSVADCARHYLLRRASASDWDIAAELLAVCCLAGRVDDAVLDVAAALARSVTTEGAVPSTRFGDSTDPARPGEVRHTTVVTLFALGLVHHHLEGDVR